MAKKKKQSSNMLEVQNAAKTLFANIRFMSPDAPVKSIAMTSAVPNEGKTVTSVELARAIATSGKTVLLVEADMRRRSLASTLNVHSAAGIYSVLTDATPLKTAITATSVPNLYFLDVEPNIPNPADIISSKRYSKLISLLEKHYDYVIFDTPPVGTFIDAAILSTMVDGTILMVKPNSTKRADVLNAYEQLKKADANVLGVCATFCEGTGSEYYYAYYTTSGERVKADDVRAVASGYGEGGAVDVSAGRPAGRSNTPRVESRAAYTSPVDAGSAYAGAKGGAGAAGSSGSSRRGGRR